MATMETLRGQGQRDVIKTSDEGIKEAGDIGQEIEGVKNQLSDMPSGLDPELVQAIEGAKESAREEARRDVEQVMQGKIEESQRNAENIKQEINGKIADNNSAANKLSGIASKYGASEIAGAKQAIDQNTKTGEDINNELQQAVDNAKRQVEGIKNSI